MPTMPPTYRPPGSRTQQEANQSRYAARDKGKASLYSKAWHRARSVYLIEHPLCCYCERAGRLRPATVVDHVRPHQGDRTLFWDATNWQPLCRWCHDSVKQRMEAQSRSVSR